MQQLLLRHGITPRAAPGGSAMTQALAAGRPVLAHVNTAHLSNRPFGYAGGHYLVVTGVVRDGAGRVTHVVCSDPASSRGQGVRYSMRDFERAWLDRSRWFMTLA